MAIAVQLDSVERRDLDRRKTVFNGTPRMRFETVRRSLCNTPIDIGINGHAIPPAVAKHCADTDSVLLCGEIPYGLIQRRNNGELRQRASGTSRGAPIDLCRRMINCDVLVAFERTEHGR